MSAPILMIEDDENSAVLTQRILEQASIRNPFINITTGADAILYLEKNDPPILILLDLGLPDTHGLDVLKYIRKHERPSIHDLCVFVVTISDDQALVAQTIETGASAFLTKNMNLASFLAAVQDCGVSLDIG